MLPAPSQARGITGGELRCAEQRWHLALSFDPVAAAPAMPVAANLAVDGQVFELGGDVKDQEVALPISNVLVQLFKAGTRLTVEIAATPSLRAGFSLRGSRRAIDAAAPFCSKPDMSRYQRIVLSPYSPLVQLAAELRKDEIRLFRQATTAEPTVGAEMIELADGKRMLLAEICGSSWYYGVSGCNLAGFVREDSSAEWRIVYDTEGADLYIDRGLTIGGWPKLIALPKQGGGEAVSWLWSGAGYVASDPETAADAAPDSGAEGDQ
ncbi:MAG: hypothetical protein Q8Q62_11925 [Mesorhizobium sp.]|nr:hypothetical protein [Mesorhizobium sp.]